MSTRNTPLPGMRGLYIVDLPWKLSPNTLYTAVGLEQFTKLISEGVNVYGTFYKVHGISQERYEEDLALSPYIVTLYGDDGSYIKLPDTFIAKYPDQAIPRYNIYVGSFLIGPFRDNYDFSLVKAKVKEAVSDVTGVEPEVNIDIVSSNSTLSPEEADALEATRNAKIQTQESTYALYLKAIEENKELRKQLDQLMAIVPKG